MRRLPTSELDALGQRLEEIAAEEEKIRAQLREQIENFGSVPPRAEKSRRFRRCHIASPSTEAVFWGYQRWAGLKHAG